MPALQLERHGNDWYLGNWIGGQYIAVRIKIMSDKLRNRTKAHLELCKMEGIHSFVIFDRNGDICSVFESRSYDIGYRAALRMFRNHVDAVIAKNAGFTFMPATWKHTFRSEK